MAPEGAIRIHVKSPQTNGVGECFFGALEYEQLYRGYIGRRSRPDMEVRRFRIIYDTIRPPSPRRPHTLRAYLDDENRPTS